FWPPEHRLLLEVRHRIVLESFQPGLLRPHINQRASLRTIPINQAPMNVMIAEGWKQPTEPRKRPMIRCFEFLQRRRCGVALLKVAHVVSVEKIKPALLATAHKLLGAWQQHGTGRTQVQ